jgi:hypothetical protein
MCSGTAAICYPETYETVKQRAVAEGKELADVGVILAKQSMESGRLLVLSILLTL